MAVIPRSELERCVLLLESLVTDRTQFAHFDDDLRVRLLQAAGRVSRPTRDDNRKAAKAFRFVTRKKVRDLDAEARAGTEIRAARQAEVFTAPPRQLTGAAASAGSAASTASQGSEASGAGSEQAPRELITPKNCYVCKAAYRKLHFFYDALCERCAALNYDKRFQTASLEGRVALITGARVKIGFHAALMMLRAGASVVVTTRFPRDAAQRFAREEDFVAWKDRLEVFGLDLRHAPSVELFARYLTQTRDRLDILINNAAQTVRRPAGFYAHLLELERLPFSELPSEVKPLLRSHERCKDAMDPALGALSSHDVPPDAHGALVSGDDLPGGFVAWGGSGPGLGIRASAELSQVPCAYDEQGRDHELFPVGRADADLQQVDMRTMNSWRLKLADVPSPEMLEVQLVNAVAPFILCSKLKPLMMQNPTGDRHIVNVSAMEGQFARRMKTDKHPHTNMAKAALNMMTLTSAPDYAADGIFMNAVDTGWVTDEDPHELSRRKKEELDFQPPLDIVDGAARICDPFFSGLLTGAHAYGKFFKDYAPCAW